MKKIMILAGGNDQIALIQELRHYWKNSVEIILIDQSTCVRAVEYADRFYKYNGPKSGVECCSVRGN